MVSRYALDTLLNDDNASVLAALALNPRLCSTSQETLSRDRRPIVRYSLAQNRAVLPAILTKLANDPVQNIAQRAGMTMTELDFASAMEDPETQSCYASAGNPETAPGELRQLAQDPRPFIRQRVARNPSTPGAVLDKLLWDSSLEVRTAVGANPSATKSALNLVFVARSYAADSASSQAPGRQTYGSHAAADDVAWIGVRN